MAQLREAVSLYLAGLLRRVLGKEVRCIYNHQTINDLTFHVISLCVKVYWMSL